MSKMYVPHKSPGQVNNEPTLTQQHYAEKADINNIVARAMQTGTPPTTGFGRPGIRPRKPLWGDFSSVDHLAYRNKIADMESIFRRLPPRVRARFRGSPELLMRWVEDPANHEEAVKLGLLVDVKETYEEAEKRIQEEVKAESNTTPKADEEANPSYKK